MPLEFNATIARETRGCRLSGVLVREKRLVGLTITNTARRAKENSPPILSVGSVGEKTESRQGRQRIAFPRPKRSAISSSASEHYLYALFRQSRNVGSLDAFAPPKIGHNNSVGQSGSNLGALQKIKCIDTYLELC